MKKIKKVTVIITDSPMPIGFGITQKIEVDLDKKKYEALKADIIYKYDGFSIKLAPMESPYEKIRDKQKKY